MSGVLLEDFLVRMHRAGADLTGCLIARKDMETPHVFNELSFIKAGRARIKVRTGGSQNIATMMDELVVESLSVEPDSRLVSKNRQVLKIYFEYP